MTKTDPFAAANHHELELKFEVTRVKGVDDTSLVNVLCQRFEKAVTSVVSVGCPDTYYRQGKNVVRFRDQPGRGELTVKLRTSKSSITNRVEVDIPLKKSVTGADTEAFLRATGWKPEVKLYKTSTIVRLGQDKSWWKAPVIIAWYKVSLFPNLEREGNEGRSFIEIELDKEHLKDLEEAPHILEQWHQWFRKNFPGFPKKPVGKSLYELYTGKTYQLAKEKTK